MATIYATGSAGVDRVFIDAGTVVDATRLGGSMDKVYFTGRWADYTKVVQGSTIRFTRTLNGYLEDVLVSAGAGVLNDLLVFADGNVSSQQAATQLLRSASVGLAAAGGLTGTSAEKSSLPALASARVLALSADTGVAGDGITSTPQQTISGSFSGVLRNGDRVQVQVNGVWLDAQVTSNTGSSGSFRLEGVTLQAVSQVLAVRVQDITGRSVLGTGKSVVLDSDAPVATLSVAPTEDAWVNASESGVTVLVGVAGVAGLKAGDAVQLRRAADAHSNTWTGSTVVVTAAHLAAGAVRVWVPKSALADGVNALTARLTDVAGNVGSTEVLQVSLDTQVARPVLSVVPGQDARLSAGEPSLDVRVSGGVGSLALREDDWVQLWRGGAALGVAHRVTAPEAQANALDLSVQRTALGGNGTYALTARVWDAAGNVGVSPQALTVVVDTRGPASLLDVSGLAGDTQQPLASGLTDRVLVADEAFVWLRIQGLAAVTEGTLRSGDRVTLLHQVGNQMVALTDAHGQVYRTTVGAEGGVAYLKVLKSDLPVSGLQVFQVQVQDGAGNVGLSNKLGVQADTQGPTLSSVVPPTVQAVGPGGAGVALLRESDGVVLTVTFDEAVSGLTSGQDSSVLAVAGAGVVAHWAGTDGSAVRTLTYRVAAGDSGAVAVNESALKAALERSLLDMVGNAFRYTDHGGQVPDIDGVGHALPVVNARPTGGVRVSGDTTQGQTLAADVSGLSDAEGLGTLSYQWLANGAELMGATGASHLLTVGEVGQRLAVRVSYHDGQGVRESVTSEVTLAVAPLSNHRPVGAVVLNGVAEVGSRLSADVSSVSDADGLGIWLYQWYANDTALVGATASTLLLTASEVGKTVSVTARYTDGSGTAEAVSSAASDVVVSVNHVGRVQESGSLMQGGVLSAVLSDGDGVGSEVLWQWLANGLEVADATASTFTLTQAQVGQAMSVRATYTDDLGTEETVTQAFSGTVGNVNDAPTGQVAVTGDATQGQTLTADVTALTDVDGLGVLSYQWLVDGSALNGATGNQLLLSASEVGKAVSVRVRYTDGWLTPESVTSAQTLAVASASNHRPTGVVTVSGTAAKDGVLTADASAVADADGLGTLSYQWFAGGVAVAGANSAHITLARAQVGKAMTVQVSYTDAGGTQEAVSSTATDAVANVNAAPVGSVTLAGTATQYKTLTVDASGIADADGLGAFSYQWLADGAEISGATGSSLSLKQAQVGQAISVRVRYTDGGGTVEMVTSSGTAAVGNVNDAPAGAVSISGTATQGQTLTARVSGLKDLDGLGTLHYQWLADGVDIANATASTFTMAQAQVGKAMSVRVQYTDALGTAESITGSALYAISLGVGNGQLLAPVGVDGGKNFYYWDKNGNGLADDTMSMSALLGLFKWNSAYTATGNSVSTTYRYGTLGGVRLALPTDSVLFGTQTGTAVAGDAVNATYDGLPAIWDALNGAGTEVGGAGVPAEWAGGSNAYFWGADQSLSGAHYIFGLYNGYRSSNMDTALRHVALELVPASGSYAPPGLKVANVNDVGTVTIEGTVQQGQTLIAHASDADGLSGPVTYQWRVGGLDTGVTAGSYVLKQSDVGKAVSVQVAFQDDTGVSESASATTVNVANLNDLPGGSVTLSGTARQYDTLSASVALTDLDGMTTSSYSYQWRADGSDITGATGTTFKLSQAQVGKRITLAVSYTDDLGTKETVVSDPSLLVANVLDPVTGSVSLSGTMVRGQPVTAVTTSLKDTDGLGALHYQWMADGTSVGTDSATYTPVDPDLGKALSVTVSYTDGQGALESITSSVKSSISLGAYGQLLLPVSVDNGHLYYIWDKSGDGAISTADKMTFATLDDYAATNSFVANANGGVSPSNPYFLINGVRLMLPQSTPSFGNQPGTTVSGLAQNDTYNGLAAIWDAFNGGEVTSTTVSGLPPSWASGNYWGQEYGSAVSPTSHAVFVLNTGYRTTLLDTTSNYVAFELVGSSAGYVAPSTVVL